MSSNVIPHVTLSVISGCIYASHRNDDECWKFEDCARLIQFFIIINSHLMTGYLGD